MLLAFEGFGADLSQARGTGGYAAGGSAAAAGGPALGRHALGRLAPRSEARREARGARFAPEGWS